MNQKISKTRITKKSLDQNATYPRIYFGKKYIGGHNDLIKIYEK